MPSSNSNLLKVITRPIVELMTLQEAAGYLGCHCHPIRRIALEGKIPCFKLRNRWRFSKSELDEWIAEGGARRILWRLRRTVHIEQTR